MFLSYLESAHQKYEAVVHAYCLMSNYYHLMIETPSGNLPLIMKYINGSYTDWGTRGKRFKKNSFSSPLRHARTNSYRLKGQFAAGWVFRQILRNASIVMRCKFSSDGLREFSAA